jgi:peptidoglycan hydrolase-like protein with peptidoglycan-binding domain
VSSRRRILVIIAVVAVLATGLGLALGRELTSPEDAAARTAAPQASRITVPVEQRTLSSRVVGRGDASFDGAVNVTIETGGLQTRPVVTGQVPKVGATVREGKPLLEIAGRPVLALAGVLPMYRTLRPGLRGPDVRQLEQVLHRLGYDPGTVDDLYTADTSAAVVRLYNAAGYEPPAVDEQLTQAADQAQQQVDQAEESVRSARKALDRAGQGPSQVQRIQADNAVRDAERNLADARRSGNARAIAQAQEQLRLAKAQRAELLAAKDTSAERSALDDAEQKLADARSKLSEARLAAGIPLPVSEIFYVRSLPRRVDDMKVSRGSLVSGTVMSVSGANLVVTIQVDAQTKQLLRTGMPASFDLGDGENIAATVLRITRSQDKYDVVLAPKRLTSRQLELIRNANVRVTIPVKSTRGKVLAVPVSALSAGSGGESRVEVVRGDGRVELVTVQVGLSADGYAEIRPTGGGRLSPGDQVVVGK